MKDHEGFKYHGIFSKDAFFAQKLPVGVAPVIGAGLQKKTGWDE